MAIPCAQVLLRQSTLPEDGDAGGLVLDWAEVDALEQGDFVRFRRHTVHECWQCAANALGAREVLRLVCASLALSGHGMTAGGGGWRPLEATLTLTLTQTLTLTLTQTLTLTLTLTLTRTAPSSRMRWSRRPRYSRSGCCRSPTPWRNHPCQTNESHGAEVRLVGRVGGGWAPSLWCAT